MDKENAVDTCNGVLSSLEKKKDILQYVIAWVNLEDRKSERSPSQKDKHYMTPFDEASHIGKHMEIDNRMMVTSGQGKGHIGSFSMG